MTLNKLPQILKDKKQEISDVCDRLMVIQNKEDVDDPFIIRVHYSHDTNQPYIVTETIALGLDGMKMLQDNLSILIPVLQEYEMLKLMLEGDN